MSKLRQLSWHYPRYGYRMIVALLRREGWRVNRKRVYRSDECSRIEGKVPQVYVTAGPGAITARINRYEGYLRRACPARADGTFALGILPPGKYSGVVRLVKDGTQPQEVLRGDSDVRAG